MAREKTPGYNAPTMTEHEELRNHRLEASGIGPIEERVERRLRLWGEMDFGARLWRKDPSLWSSDPASEIADRLGWLDLPRAMDHTATECAALAASVRGEDFRHCVLLGMGGSSLAPEVLQKTFGVAAGGLPLLVLDTTHPKAVLEVERAIDPARTLFVVSSKSGTTIETISGFRYFWHCVSKDTQNPGRRFVAITDPGTPLQTLARERGFRHVFTAPRDVGGRYSALSPFGLLPAALLGTDVHELLSSGLRMVEACGPGVDPARNPALHLGALLGELALAGRDKLTFIAEERIASFPVWVEQLVAESTGKAGCGIVPVAVEPPRAPGDYAGDRVFVHLQADGAAETSGFAESLAAAGHPVLRTDWGSVDEIGAEFFRWEMAVAAAGAVFGINPFDQPDVERAKKLARDAMAGGSDAGGDDAGVAAGDGETLREALGAWLASARDGDYAAIHAYLAPGDRTDAALATIRRAIGEPMRLATTCGYGPRFLHSTGQLHKGGPNTGLFLQLVDEPGDDVPVPETDYSFRDVIRAQALGDYRALEEAGRRVLRVRLGADPVAALECLAREAAAVAERIGGGEA